jgi:hypothetical protein
MLGSIIFVKTSSPISWIIRKVTKSPWSHCCISLNDNNDIIIEADVFKKVSVKKNPYKKYEVVDVEINDSQRQQLLFFLHSKINVKYDYIYILGILLRLLKLRKNDMWSDKKNRLMCSELTDDAFASIGIDLVPNRKFDNVTPGELYDALKERK